MENYFDRLQHCRLFKGFERADFDKILGCLGASVKTFEKNNLVFRNFREYRIGIVLSGKVNNVQIDYHGNKN